MSSWLYLSRRSSFVLYEGYKEGFFCQRRTSLGIKEEAGRQFAFAEAGVHICRRSRRERKVQREREREGGRVVAQRSHSIHETTRPALIFLTPFGMKCKVPMKLLFLVLFILLFYLFSFPFIYLFEFFKCKKTIKYRG